MLKNIKAAIFDMDGTLIDSMWVWEKIDVDYLGRKGFELPPDLQENIQHRSFEETAKYFKERFHISDTIDEIMNEWTEMAEYEYTHNVKLKPGVKEYLTFLKSINIKLGLATSNSIPLLEVVLKNNGIYDYFDIIATTNEVQRGKDFPDIYLLTANRLEVFPDECIVFEDILPAVLGAKAAGMKVVGVYDKHSDYQKKAIQSAADHFIEEYATLTEAI